MSYYVRSVCHCSSYPFSQSRTCGNDLVHYPIVVSAKGGTPRYTTLFFASSAVFVLAHDRCNPVGVEKTRKNQNLLAIYFTMLLMSTFTHVHVPAYKTANCAGFILMFFFPSQFHFLISPSVTTLIPCTDNIWPHCDAKFILQALFCRVRAEVAY